MPSPEQIQAIKRDKDSNYYAIAFGGIKKSQNLPRKQGFDEIYLTTKQIMYADIYRSLLTTAQAATLFESDQSPFDLFKDSPTKILTENISRENRISEEWIEALFPVTDNAQGIQLSPYDRQQIQANPNSQKTVLFHLLMMLEFYGLKLKIERQASQPAQDKIKIEGIKYDKNHWIYNNSIHYEYITQILKSLCLLGLKNYALAFYNGLAQIYEEISKHFSNSMPRTKVSEWQDVAAKDNGQLSELDSSIDDDANVKLSWDHVVTRLQAYHNELTDNGKKGPGFFNKETFPAKSAAALNILKTLIDNPIMEPTGVSAITTDLGNEVSTQQLLERMQRAGAMARAYVAEFSLVTEGIVHHRLYDILTEVIETQKACITGKFADLAARLARR